MSLLDFRLQNARVGYPNGLDTQELRESRYGLIMKAKESRLLADAARQTIENAWGTPQVKIPVLSQNKPTVTDGPMDCAFGDSEANGEFIDVTYVSGYVPLAQAYREAYSLDLTAEQIFERMFRDAELAIYDDIETKLFNLLDNNKATTYNSSFVGAGLKFPLAGDALQVSTTEQQFFFNFAKAIMGADDFPQSGLEVIGNTNLSAYVNQYINQGNANNTNSQFQYSGFNFDYSNFVDNTAAVSSVATGFIMPQNSISMIGRVSPEARTGQSTTKGVEWMTYSSELLGIDLEVMYQSDCSNVTAKTGNAIDIGGKLEQWKIGYNIALLTPYALRTNSGIKKFDFLP